MNWHKLSPSKRKLSPAERAHRKAVRRDVIRAALHGKCGEATVAKVLLGKRVTPAAAKRALEGLRLSGLLDRVRIAEDNILCQIFNETEMQAVRAEILRALATGAEPIAFLAYHMRNISPENFAALQDLMERANVE